VSIIGDVAAILTATFSFKSTRLMKKQLKIAKRESYLEWEGEIEKLDFK